MLDHQDCGTVGGARVSVTILLTSSLLDLRVQKYTKDVRDFVQSTRMTDDDKSFRTHIPFARTLPANVSCWERHPMKLGSDTRAERRIIDYLNCIRLHSDQAYQKLRPF